MERGNAMTITLTIPDDVAAQAQSGNAARLSRRLLEIAAIELYKSDQITSRQVQEMLGFEDREQLFAFFKANDVLDHSFTMDELNRGRETMAALLAKR
jgi:hypothetical protein